MGQILTFNGKEVTHSDEPSGNDQLSDPAGSHGFMELFRCRVSRPDLSGSSAGGHECLNNIPQ